MNSSFFLIYLVFSYGIDAVFRKTGTLVQISGKLTIKYTINYTNQTIKLLNNYRICSTDISKKRNF